MSAIKAMLKGLGRVLASPSVVIWLWFVNFLVALPAAWVMTSALEESIGHSLVHERLTEDFDMGWYGEYAFRARGLEETFSPTVTGAGAFFDNLEAWFRGEMFTGFSGLVGLGALYAVLWAFFLGGVLARYSGGEGLFSLSRFMANGAKFFFRFVRLAAIASVLYYGIYRFSAWLFEWIEEATKDVTVERVVLAYVLIGAALVVFLMSFVNMAFDYAKIAAFKENRRSMLLAAVRGLGFVLAHPAKTSFVYYGLGAVGIALLAIYYTMAPGATQSTPFQLGLAFLVAQAYLVVKLVLRLTFYGAQMALYEAGTASPGS